MEQAISSSQALYLGCEVTPLVFVEVTPLQTAYETDPTVHSAAPAVSAPRVKMLLRRKTLVSTVSKHGSIKMVPNTDRCMENDSSVGLTHWSLSFPMNDSSDLCWACLQTSRRVVPVVHLPSENPTVVEPVPCWIVGYGTQDSLDSDTVLEALITDSTLVRILPVEPATIRAEPQETASLAIDPPGSRPIKDWRYTMMGESCHRPLSAEIVAEVFYNHDAETVRALTLRMSMLLSQPIAIGTTADAFRSKQKRQSRERVIHGALGSYLRSKDSNATVPPAAFKNKVPSDSAVNKFPSFLQEGALIVHSPNHGAGKTLLVQAIAQEKLKCAAIHIVQPTSLLAQYGIHADAALESLLHSILMSAACQQKSVCIILDHLDAMIPPHSSSRASAGDAALPVLKAIASYLKGLTLGLKRNHVFSFPTKNHLYNLGGTDGHVLDVNLCLIGIMTCDDDGVKPRGTTSNLSWGLDMLVAGRYRLPSLSAKCRLAAFQNAFKRVNVSLGIEATNRLPILAASAVEARGHIFSDVARCLANLSAEKDQASLADLKSAFSVLQRGGSPLSKVEFTENDSDVSSASDLFSSVGGNVEAKKSIEEALALESEKRRILQSFGLSPPTGLLLFGPPGTGKTLLAKSVAKLLKSHNGNLSSIGGSFVTIQASEVVRGEVGNSEKMIVSAFETARSNAPSVVFIDEFQALFTERSGSGSGKLTSTLLQCMDDVCRWRDMEGDENTQEKASVESSRVVVMGATNTPWMVDKAFLRPGRFDRIVHVGLPVLEERVSILKVHVSRMSLVSSEKAFVERICQSLADECDGYSGADLAALCRAAAVICLNEHGANGLIDERHFRKALEGFEPSCSAELAEQLSTWRP